VHVRRMRWAREELNLRPLPCQQTAGKRCATRRFLRSPPTVDGEVKRSPDEPRAVDLSDRISVHASPVRAAVTFLLSTHDDLALHSAGGWSRSGPGPRRSLDSSRFVRFNLRGAAAVNMLLHRSGGHRGVNNDPDICLITRERRGPGPKADGCVADGDSAGIPPNTIQHSVTGTTLPLQADAAPKVHCSAHTIRVERRANGEASSVMTRAEVGGKRILSDGWRLELAWCGG
jgi:hypothetical protein